MTLTFATTAAATWCYLIGESVGSYLGFIKGGLALGAGCMIGMLLVLLAAGPACVRFGIDSIAATKPQFGSRGWVIPAALQAVSIIGWNSLLIIFFAKSAVQLSVALGLLEIGSRNAALVPVLTVLACAVIFLALRRGATGVSMVSNILVAHVFIGLWMLYLLVSRRWPELMAAQPPNASPDRMWNYTTGVELGIGATLSWWPYIGAMIRMAPNGRTIVLPVMLGMAAPVPLLSLIGLAGSLVLKSSDPSEWLRIVGGPTYAIVSLSFVTAANFGTTTAGIYASRDRSAKFRGLAKTHLDNAAADHHRAGRLGRNIHTGIVFRQVRQFSRADRRRIRAALRHTDRRLFHSAPRPHRHPRNLWGSPRHAYYFWRGINPAAMAALTAGCVTYVALLNPLSYDSAALYPYLTASLPSTAVAGLVYLFGGRLVIRAGRGGYS